LNKTNYVSLRRQSIAPHSKQICKIAAPTMSGSKLRAPQATKC